MNREQIVGWITETLATDFEVERDRIVPDAHLVDDLGLDSLDAIDMMSRLQEISGSRIEEEAVRGIERLEDVIDLAERFLANSPVPE